jgi:hypothetical protein
MVESPRGRARSPPSASLLRYYLYEATRAVEIYCPIVYLFFLAQGPSFTQMAILEALPRDESVCKLHSSFPRISVGGHGAPTYWRAGAPSIV